MWDSINNLGIKAKLIFIFVIIKIVPLGIVAYIALIGAQNVGSSFVQDSTTIIEKSSAVVSNTANIAIEDSIKALDKKSQSSLERLSQEIAKNVSEFLYERDKDILFLAQTDLNQALLSNFYNIKTRPITIHEPYEFDEKTGKWVSSLPPEVEEQKSMKAELPDNDKEFNYNPPKLISKETIPLYKEITFYDLNGQEQLKVSSIDQKLKNIADFSQTYLKAERYYDAAKSLQKGEIYVSDVIGAYVGSKVIGTYTPEKAKKAGLPFEPEKSGYAGKENPAGKPFDGIIRFVTPVFQGERKTGYLTMALDHRHIMDFTDPVVPIEGQFYDNISDAAIGNYAFMWDYKGRNISHPRDYFIVGFDPETGERVPGWISKDLADRWKASGIEDLNRFLETVKPFDNQSLKQKPNIPQLKQGQIALDCRRA